MDIDMGLDIDIEDEYSTSALEQVWSVIQA